LISCHKYKDIRKTFFQSYGLNLKDSRTTGIVKGELYSIVHIVVIMDVTDM
jgi:hypothetical protein